MTRLDEFKYVETLGCRMLCGRVYGHPSERFRDGDSITPSVPTYLDREKRILRTKSGGMYELGVCSAVGGEEVVFDQIEKDIARGSYEVVSA